MREKPLKRLPSYDNPKMTRCKYCPSRNQDKHVYGCPGELCPKCSQPLIGCQCNAIAGMEQDLIVEALRAKMIDRDSAINASSRSASVRPFNSNLTMKDRAAILYYLDTYKDITPQKIAKALQLHSVEVTEFIRLRNTESPLFEAVRRNQAAMGIIPQTSTSKGVDNEQA